MADRKAELEKKRVKLQMMREEKERRRKEKELKDAEEAVGRTGGIGDRDQRKDLDSMLSSLGVAPVADVMSSLSSVNSAASESNLPEANILSSVQSGARKQRKLCTIKVQETNIPPKEIISYAKQTQTTNSNVERDAQSFGYYVLTYDEAEDEENSLLHMDSFNTSKLPPGILPIGLPQVKETPPAKTPMELIENKKEEPKPIVTLSEDEKLKICLSEQFQNSVGKLSRVMERLLAERPDTDIYKDYTGLADRDDLGDEKSASTLNFNRLFSYDKSCQSRTVTYMDWSTHHPELLLASYHRSRDRPSDTEGVCLIWNTKVKKTTPEFEFVCQSPVLSACFAKFNPHLVIGGTYSGQIVLWDCRVQKKTPLHRTPLSVSTHTHPVFCMNVVGTQNAHNLITISNDGRMCTWNLEMLSTPVETRDLQNYNQKQTKNLTPMALAFPQNDVNNFVVGCEDGLVYSASRHGSRSTNVECYEGHDYQVVGISSHRATGNVDFSHLFLTSSYDCSVKLWSIKENKPIHTFSDYEDYVFDVQWSPINPAVFASVQVDGKVDLYNINSEFEVNTTSARIKTKNGLNRVVWTPCGTQLCVGDGDGGITMFDVGEQLAYPRQDEWTKMVHTLQEIKNFGAYYSNPVEEKLSTSSSLTTQSSIGYSSSPTSLTSLPK